MSHTSTFYILPEQRFAISILSNGTFDDFRGSIIAAMTSLVELPAPTTPPELPFDPAGLDALTGTYADPNNVGDLVITRVGDALEVSAPTLDQYQVPYEHALSAVTTRVWLATVQDEQLDVAFIDGPDGEMYLRNRAFVAIRPAGNGKPSAPSRPTREAVLRALAAARLQWSPALSPLRARD